MIDLVVRNKSNEALVQSLLDYLMGEVDNVPKDPKFLLKLYFEIGNIKVIILILYFFFK